MLALGQKLQKLRVERGMTQAELARRAGVPQPNLSNIEKEKHDLTVSTLVKLCVALEADPAGLFKDGPPSPHPAFTRTRVERLARALVEGAREKLSPAEAKIADLLGALLPKPRRRPLPTRKIQQTWIELRERLTGEEIKMLLERVHDAQARHEAKAEVDYQKLVASLKKLLGRGAG